ncbi:fimbrial protein [Pseudomonas sp. NPDC087697]|uniref:fimbrial protein n=1 Tax=Pseudomonas sp. NPDC087697 TaxID=3364447 RepID=UPI00380618F1
MKRTALILAMYTFPVLAFAASGNTISFKGQVSDQTCQVSVNGNAANPIILLPTVAASDLSAVGSTAGQTPFTIAVSGCTAPTSGLAIKTTFLGKDVTTAGNLGNSSGATKGGATNVQIQLMDADKGGKPVVLNGITSVAGLALAAGEQTASHDFAVRYISETGGATAGTVSASAQYSLDYL